MIIDNFLYQFALRKATFGSVSKGGRNYLGRICIFHRGNGNKRRYISLDIYRRLDQFGTVYKILKDSFRTCYVALVLYTNGLFSFITLAENVPLGGRLYSGEANILLVNKVNYYAIGSAVSLSSLNLFYVVHNIELSSYSGFALARAAGVGAIFTNRINNKCHLKLTSGWQVEVAADCFCVIGFASHSSHKYDIIAKAGKSRALGFRPVVRGVAKNPCDHPHGGGEGKSSPPRVALTPWGRFTKGTPTKNKKEDRLKRKFFKISS